MRRTQGNEQCRIIIYSTVNVVLQMNLCPSIKVYNAFLVTLTENHTFTLIEIDVRFVQQNHFTDTHSCRSQHINHCQVSKFCAVVTHFLQILVRIGFLDISCRFHLMDTANRTFQNIILVLQPREKAGQNPADIIYRHTTGLVLTLIIGQIGTQILRLNVADAFIYRDHHRFNGCAVVFQRFFGASFNPLCCNKGIYQLRIIVRIFLFCLHCNLTAKQCVFKHCLQLLHLCVVEVWQHLLHHF